jgi:hypothetical protein
MSCVIVEHFKQNRKNLLSLQKKLDEHIIQLISLELKERHLMKMLKCSFRWKKRTIIFLKKQNENGKNRSIQETIIGNQRPLFGNASHSQVANANKSNKNKTQKGTNVSANMSSVETTTR